MLPDEVRKAVERTDAALELAEPNHTVFIGNKAAWQTIRAHLLAREAELTELRREMDDYNAIESALEDAVATSNKHRDRAERAEALLRECLTPGLNEISLCSRMRNRITAHLSENSRG